MKRTIYILVIVTLLWNAVPEAFGAQAEAEHSHEHEVKAAFVYNFIKFVDWPPEKMMDGNEPIIIGIIGDKSFVKYFDPVKDKPVRNRKLAVKYFEEFKKTKESKNETSSEWNQKIESLKKCHVLLFCTCDYEEIEKSDRIIEALQGSSVLTVGETDGFLKTGGMINFVMEDGKVRFEINVTAADKAHLKIRSQLLRLAKTVAGENAAEDKSESSGKAGK